MVHFASGGGGSLFSSSGLGGRSPGFQRRYRQSLSNGRGTMLFMISTARPILEAWKPVLIKCDVSCFTVIGDLVYSLKSTPRIWVDEDGMAIDGFNTAFAATAASPVLGFEESSLLSLETDSACRTVSFNILSSVVDLLKFDFQSLSSCRSFEVQRKSAKRTLL